MGYEESFGVIINLQQEAGPQFKLFAEGIKFRDNPKLIAEPASIPTDTKTLPWVTTSASEK